MDYPLNQLYAYVTDTCNLRCRHCWIAPRYTAAPGGEDGIDADLFASVLDEALPLGLTAVKLTGGEPLCHPRFDRLLEAVRERELGLSVETNGTLVTADAARLMASRGGAFVSVSLDSADPAVHEAIRGVEGCFAAAVRGIENLVAAGLRPQVIMTVMGRDRRDLEGLAFLARDLGASSVKFNIVQPTARGRGIHERGDMPTVPELVALGRWVDRELAPSLDIPVIFHHPPAFLSLSRMFGPGGDGCHNCGIKGILGILADGSYALCGIGVTVPELVFGRAGRDPLAEVWRHNEVLRGIRENLPRGLKGVCASCLLKGVCLGGCIAVNYGTTKDLWAPFWYCRQAFEAGLFPEGRLLPGSFPTN
ncbi:MAG TPA: SynChlorMet cassette radical SAM/SPASM protein ScmF [Syntrophales bacterium]|nr:SynChlorMet cassette radical SAM/SPASM protein ScmF [Syntrophales bacterium]HOM07498.1 SynChlorMet cassette radical SAM/SPASM protein ScmF [Syntrophales bacterium]HOO00033.1 SynChlorMet cassette radical SAM/SPASM protein ScmF [Syntrophales bacterium]HPC00853.1 SynChlorMet cassette radical SAM/SPASM protein ScmF [Syntrophales bacterium]HPQ07117.1 SynChlorMet cassette radical SAM/SPASM protein ScmF [Syntrophales bacterium]